MADESGTPIGSKEDSLPAPDPIEVQTPVAVARRFAQGEVIDGRFEVLQELGEGGFSTVYKVRDTVENEERALKVFKDASGYEAVRREIGVLRRINHRNVVKVFWADKTDSGQWFLVSEFVEGEQLQRYVDGRSHLRDREAVDVALDLLDALVAIHPNSERLDALAAKDREGGLTPEEFAEMQELKDTGFVHRDIKPLNLMLSRQGAKLLDFNIASRVGDPVKTISGTPPYQPPDPSFTAWDVAPDLFATGVTLYELLCDGGHPYEDSAPALNVEATDPRAFRPDLDADLAEFLVKACAPFDEERFHTAMEMRDTLRKIRDRL